VNFSHVTTSGVLNYSSAMLLLFLLGTNISFIIQAAQIFHPRTTRFWRLFFLGKTVISAVLVDVLLQFPSPFTWRLAIIDVGAAISLGALVVIYKDRPYRSAIVATLRQIEEEMEEDDAR
jgi:hypothetical protein